MVNGRGKEAEAWFRRGQLQNVSKKQPRNFHFGLPMPYFCDLIKKNLPPIAGLKPVSL